MAMALIWSASLDRLGGWAPRGMSSSSSMSTPGHRRTRCAGGLITPRERGRVDWLRPGPRHAAFDQGQSGVVAGQRDPIAGIGPAVHAGVQAVVADVEIGVAGRPAVDGGELDQLGDTGHQVLQRRGRDGLVVDLEAGGAPFRRPERHHQALARRYAGGGPDVFLHDRSQTRWTPIITEKINGSGHAAQLRNTLISVRRL